jgi:cell division protein FtsW
MNRRIDPWLLALTTLLLVLGLVMIYSASAVVAEEWTGDPMRYVKRQAIAILVGGVLCAASAVTPTRIMRKYRAVFYFACLIGLVLTFVPGIQHSAKGAERWIGFGSINLQPSEFAKIAVLLSLAHFLDRWRGFIGDYRVIVRSLITPVPVLIAVVLQPDFGTTVIIGGLCAVMYFVAGMRPLHMVVCGTAVVAGGVPLMIMEPYRVERLMSFLDPWKVADGSGHQVIQSWIAMHSGGLWGSGLGNSMAKLHYLPEPWTDFIGSVIAEELGLVRFVLLIGLFGLLAWRGLLVARRARDAFGMFLAATLTGMIGLEAIFNFAVIMGMVPPKGLVLPFVSYGSSAMISHLWAIGILLSIAAEADGAPATEGWPNRKGGLMSSETVQPLPAR